MVIKFRQRPESPDSIFPKLKEWYEATDHRVLFLIHKETGATYTVVSYDPETRRVGLTGDHGLRAQARLSEREDKLYHAVWR